MKFTAEQLGGLIFPLLAIGYASYSLWEQFTGDYMALTQDYSLLINIPILLLGVAAMVQILTKLQIKEHPANEPSTNGQEGIRSAAKPAGLFLLSALLVVSISYLGYAIAFGALVFFSLLLMGVRSPVRLVGISLVIAVIVHYVFVEVLRLQLPVGLLG